MRLPVSDERIIQIDYTRLKTLEIMYQKYNHSYTFIYRVKIKKKINMTPVLNRKYNFIRIPVEDTTLQNLIHHVISLHRENLDKYMSINVQVRDVTGNFFTIGERIPVNIDDKSSIDNYISIFMMNYDNLAEYYKTPHFLYYYLNYINLSEKEYTEDVKRLESVEKTISIDTEMPLNFPLNTHYTSWGNETFTDKDGNLIVKGLNVTNSLDPNRSNERSIKVTFNTNSNIIDIYVNDTIIKSITDKIISDNEFIRYFDRKEYHIRNNVPYFFFERKFSHKYIGTLTQNKAYVFNSMTLDIETYLDPSNVMQVYCISFFDGEICKSFFITDYNNDLNLMLKDLFKSLFMRKYSGKTMYIHNSSYFDLNFLLKHLLSYPHISLNPIIKDGKFINLEIKYGKFGISSLNLRDSLLLLPSSLSKLCKAFNVEKAKDIFPHKFVSLNNLDYVGPVPAYNYFDSNKVSLLEYTEYANRFADQPWNLKAEAIKYCELDCTSLYEVLCAFSLKIFEKYNINIAKCPTLPSLAFRIFRVHYLNKDIKLPVLINSIFEDISKAYYGGHVDMYIPSNDNNEMLYSYDVNSLFPSEMKNNKYPINLLAHFKGDITTKPEFVSLYENTENVGFYKVKLEAPSIEHPIIPRKEINGRSVYQEGDWTGWYYSEELKNASKLGYKYTILEGYIFSSQNIFGDFVEELSKMKESSNKNSAEYIIAKLLMNSLYGKFGMKPITIEHSFVNKEALDSFIESVGRSNFILALPIGEKYLVSYYTVFTNKYLKINIAIAAAVTAYSRIYMSQFKNNPDFKLYYSDTDGMVTDKPLPDSLVDSKKLGMMKLENIYTKFIALGPKTYGARTLEGHEIVKVKGLKNSPTLSELEAFLMKENPDKISLYQDKWHRSIKGGFIEIKKDTPYDLKISTSKRGLIFDAKGKLIGTKNLCYSESKGD